MEKETVSLSELSQDLGWSLAGVSSPHLNEKSQVQLETWLKDYGGNALGYMERRKRERKEPTYYFKEVQSILCFGLYYFPGWAEGSIKVSNYAWGQDYHEVLRRKLEQTVDWLRLKFGEFQYRICIDTSPVLEKALAVQAGIGWQGKNTLMLNPKFGSMFFLGELMTSLPLNTFSELPPMQDHCGTCNRCIEACPTNALEPYILKLDRCIAYWNLEHRGPLPEHAPSFHGWLGGCDICQQVCPWNRKLNPLEEVPKDLQKLDDETLDLDLEAQFQGRALSYVPSQKWKLNQDWIKNNS